MNWDLKTASGREKLLIRERKTCALYKMKPDLIADKPYSFFPYMAENCVFRSERLPRPLSGQAIRDFLIREKRSAEGFGPSPMANMAESEEDGDILLRIRPRFGDDEPDGELIRLELDAEGKICLIDRFDEKKVKYRTFTTCIGLTPEIRGERNKAEEISFSSLYYDVVALIFDILPSCPFFDEMEERRMDLSVWMEILDYWKKINATAGYEELRQMVFAAEEEYLRQDRGYADELDQLIRSLLETREPYGRRMQQWMEDWLAGCAGKYDSVWKC